MKNQKFGVEVEMTGISRTKAAEIIAQHFGTEYHNGLEQARDNQGRVWKLVYDGSISAEGSRDYCTEMVTPICTYSDIEEIQKIVRKLKQAGAVTNKSCGIHIHINAEPHTAQSLKNISNIMASKEALLFKALSVDSARASRYCKRINSDYISDLNKTKRIDKPTIKELWYKPHCLNHNSRYHALNLHSVWTKGTIEFRLFNGTLHAGKIKAYIQLCLAISHQALTQKFASAKVTSSTNEKYTFRTWLLRLGLIGKEFETARYHLLKNLTGDIAWHDNRRQIA